MTKWWQWQKRLRDYMVGQWASVKTGVGNSKNSVLIHLLKNGYDLGEGLGWWWHIIQTMGVCYRALNANRLDNSSPWPMLADHKYIWHYNSKQIISKVGTKRWSLQQRQLAIYSLAVLWDSECSMSNSQSLLIRRGLDSMDVALLVSFRHLQGHQCRGRTLAYNIVG